MRFRTIECTKQAAEIATTTKERRTNIYKGKRRRMKLVKHEEEEGEAIERKRLKITKQTKYYYRK